MKATTESFIPSLILAGLLLLVAFLAARPAQAQAQAYPGGYTLMPLTPGTVRLLSMTVDATIRDHEGEALVDVQAVFRVHNRDRGQAQTLSFAFPGYPADFPPPEQWSLNVRGHEITYGAAQTQWWVGDVTLEADERLNLVLSYTASLGDTSFLRFRYPMALTAQLWPGVLESARVTLAFSEPPNPQSWLQLTPETYKLTAEAITWSYDAVDPAEDIDYHLIHPALWEQLRGARQRAATAPAAAAYRELGDIYARLATDAGDQTLFERYFSLAVAAYSQAQSLDAGDASAYLALARLYRRRAELSQPPDATYISLAVSELASALEQGADDAEVAAAVVDDFTMLAARARAAGDFTTAQAYLDRLQRLADANRIPLESARLQEERLSLAVDWASATLRDQGPGPAREVLSSHFGPEIIAQPPGTRFAALNSLHLSVETEPGHRRLRIEAAPRAGEEGVLSELQLALGSAGTGALSLDDAQPPALIIDLTYADAAGLRSQLQALAAALPSRPEWALLANALTPQRLSWQEHDERWRLQERYEESVNLVSAAATLAEQAQALEQVAQAAPQNDALNALLAQLWRAEADVWRRLGDNSSARYTLTLDPTPGAPIVRTWSLELGEQAQMVGEARHYRLAPYALAALALYLFFVGLTWGLWQWRRRQQPATASTALKP